MSDATLYNDMTKKPVAVLNYPAFIPQQILGVRLIFKALTVPVSQWISPFHLMRRLAHGYLPLSS